MNQAFKWSALWTLALALNFSSQGQNNVPDSLVGTRVLVQATANDGYKENVDYFFGPSTVRYKYSDEEVTESYVATKSGSSYVVSLGSGDLLNLSFSTLTTGSGTYEDRESFSSNPGPGFQWLGGNLYKDLKGSANLTFTVFAPQMGLLLTPFAPPEVTDLTKQLAMHRKQLEVPKEDPPHSIVNRLPPRNRKPTAPK